MFTNNNEYFFKPHNQGLHRHCEQIQEVVKTSQMKHKQTKKFVYEYFRDGIPTLKSCKLNSANDQLKKTLLMDINKEVGAEKRKVTLEINKQAKAKKKANRFAAKIRDAHEFYVRERERRFNELGLNNANIINQGTTLSFGANIGNTNIVNFLISTAFVCWKYLELQSSADNHYGSVSWSRSICRWCKQWKYPEL